MQVPPAMSLRRSGRPARWVALLAACTAAPKAYHPGALDQSQLAICRAVESAYRSESPDYPARRDAAAADPVVAAWITRMFVRDVILARENRPIGDDDALLLAAAGIDDPMEERAVAEIVALGAAAVPTLVGDLLRHDQSQLREIGVELLARIGAPSIPALIETAASPVPRHRRAAARALGGIGMRAEVLAALRELAADADFTVRADAMRGLARGGAPERDLLIERLLRDDDPFVRRVAAQALAGYRDRAAATALIDFMARCQQSLDRPGENAAQQSLMQIAGARGPRTIAAWRQFATQLPTGSN